MFLLLLHEEAPTARVKTILFFAFYVIKLYICKLNSGIKTDHNNDKYKAKRRVACSHLEDSQ